MSALTKIPHYMVLSMDIATRLVGVLAVNPDRAQALADAEKSAVEGNLQGHERGIFDLAEDGALVDVHKWLESHGMTRDQAAYATTHIGERLLRLAKEREGILQKIMETKLNRTDLPPMWCAVAVSPGPQVHLLGFHPDRTRLLELSIERAAAANIPTAPRQTFNLSDTGLIGIMEWLAGQGLNFDQVRDVGRDIAQEIMRIAASKSKPKTAPIPMPDEIL